MTIDAMSKMSAQERAERRRKQAELAAELKSTGALDEVFARIDAGLVGNRGLLSKLKCNDADGNSYHHK